MTLLLLGKGHLNGVCLVGYIICIVGHVFRSVISDPSLKTKWCAFSRCIADRIKTLYIYFVKCQMKDAATVFLILLSSSSCNKPFCGWHVWIGFSICIETRVVFRRVPFSNIYIKTKKCSNNPLLSYTLPIRRGE